MNSPYNTIQLQQIQQQLHQHFVGLNNGNMSMMLPVHLGPPMMNTRPHKQVSEPIVVQESDEEDDEEQRTLFVANLDERVTEELLYEVFLQAGPIERVKIPKDNAGRARSFGFVTYTSRISLPYAMHLLKGLSLYRKSLAIKFQNKAVLPPLNKSPIGVGNSNDNGNGNSNNSRHSYDNSSLRSGNFSSYNDNNRMMNNSSPSCSSRHQERISKHASNQMRPHTNSGPYQQRRDSPKNNNNNNTDKWRHNSNSNNNHNNNNNKNGNNRYSDHRSSGKHRR